MKSIITQEVKARRLIYALLVLLVFEGLLRKITPFLGNIIFFLKDLLCVIGLSYYINTRVSTTTKKTVNFFKGVIILIYPLLLYNLFIDPILIIWGGKLYLLYFIIAILMTVAFPPEYSKGFVFFSNLLTVLFVISFLTGILQLNLPTTHWLNRSVGGDSLERFSAAGRLRISSTFSFTGQYSFFLVFACALLFCFFFLNKKYKKHTFFYLSVQLVIFLMLFIGSFSTGGRTAVLGIFAILIIGFICIGLNNSSFALKKIIVPLFIILLVFPLIQIWKPEYFAAYMERSSGTKNDEVYARVLESFYEIKNGSVLGNGLGVMTNGSDKVSAYAAAVRSRGFWTETDFRTIIWEGGYYLVIVWYGFRLLVIFYSYRILRSIKDNYYYSSASFVFAYILLNGLTGTLTIQPPLAIYFWICFGALICVQKFDEYDQNYLNQNQ